MDEDLQRIRQRKMDEIMSEIKEKQEWPAGPVEVTDGSFDDFARRYKVVLIDCWAPWCGPCRMVAPVIDELATELKGKVAFGKLNTDENQSTAFRFNINAIPTMLVFKDGEMADRIVGALPKMHIKQKLESFL